MPAANCGDSSSDGLAYDNFGFGIFLHVAGAASPSSIAALLVDCTTFPALSCVTLMN